MNVIKGQGQGRCEGCQVGRGLNGFSGGGVWTGTWMSTGSVEGSSWNEGLATCTCSDHREDLLGHAPGKKGRAHAPTTGRTFLGTLLGRKAGVYLEPGCQEREKQETGHTGAVCVPDHWRPSRWLQQEVQLYFQSNGKGFQRGSILIRYFLANHLYYIFTSIYHFFSYQTSEPTRDFFPFS